MRVRHRHLLGKVRWIGPYSLRWAEATLEHRGVQGLRTIQGLLRLSHKYSAAELERACDTAWRSGGLRYRIVQEVLKRQSAAQETMEFIDAHPVIRPLAEYQEFIRKAIQGD